MDASNNTTEERIRQLMEASQMSQKDFAERTEISPASLSSIFNGRTRATLNHIQAIHKAFPDVDTNWLLFGTGDMHTGGAAEDEGSSVPSGDGFLPFSNEPPRVVPAPPVPYRQHEDYGMRQAEPEKIRREVKEIRVFYDDGTYESFVPQK